MCSIASQGRGAHHITLLKAFACYVYRVFNGCTSRLYHQSMSATPTLYATNSSKNHNLCKFLFIDNFVVIMLVEISVIVVIEMIFYAKEWSPNLVNIYLMVYVLCTSTDMIY